MMTMTQASKAQQGHFPPRRDRQYLREGVGSDLAETDEYGPSYRSYEDMQETASVNLLREHYRRHGCFKVLPRELIEL